MTIEEQLDALIKFLGLEFKDGELVQQKPKDPWQSSECEIITEHHEELSPARVHRCLNHDIVFWTQEEAPEHCIVGELLLAIDEEKEIE